MDEKNGRDITILAGTGNDVKKNLDLYQGISPSRRSCSPLRSVEVDEVLQAIYNE